MHNVSLFFSLLSVSLSLPSLPLSLFLCRLDSPLPSSKFISFFSLVKKAFESLPDHKGDLYKVSKKINQIQLFLFSIFR